jgi:hypothetical protein
MNIMANSPEVLRPNHRSPPQTSDVAPADDIRTIMLNQVAWGAVFAGAAIALVMQIILNMIGLGVGLSTLDVAQGDSPSVSSMSVDAGVWFVISGVLAAGLGGYIAGRLSGKASRSTTAYHGLISWAVSTLAVIYLLSAAASGIVGGALSTASSALGGAGKVLGSSVQTAVQTAAPSLNNASDPMAAIENKVRSVSGGQDPAALRDAATTAVRAALTGDAAQQEEAKDKAAEALAKSQNISKDEAKTQVDQYQQQYKEAVTKTKLQAKQAADTAAKRASQGALFGALALLLGALAAFFAGSASAVTPTVSVREARD